MPGNVTGSGMLAKTSLIVLASICLDESCCPSTATVSLLLRCTNLTAGTTTPHSQLLHVNRSRPALSFAILPLYTHTTISSDPAFTYRLVNPPSALREVATANIHPTLVFLARCRPYDKGFGVEQEGRASTAAVAEQAAWKCGGVPPFGSKANRSGGLDRNGVSNEATLKTAGFCCVVYVDAAAGGGDGFF